MTDSHDEIRATILARCRQLCVDHDNAQHNVGLVQAHQRELMAEINDCFSAARLFGFDLLAELQNEGMDDPRQPTSCVTTPAAPNLSPLPAGPIVMVRPTIKAMVLEAAEKAYPSPVRASGVRLDLATRGYTIHEKTVGMTLYRWSVRGCTRRDGRDWYFVPPAQRLCGKLNGRPHKAAQAPTAAHIA
jgi:hypothetical protein